MPEPYFDIGDGNQYLRYYAGLLSIGGELIATGNIKFESATRLMAAKTSIIEGSSALLLASVTIPNTVGQIMVAATVRVQDRVYQAWKYVKFYRDGYYLCQINVPTGDFESFFHQTRFYLDYPPPGTHTYQIYLETLIWTGYEYVWNNGLYMGAEDVTLALLESKR